MQDMMSLFKKEKRLKIRIIRRFDAWSLHHDLSTVHQLVKLPWVFLRNGSIKDFFQIDVYSRVDMYKN